MTKMCSYCENRKAWAASEGRQGFVMCVSCLRAQDIDSDSDFVLPGLSDAINELKMRLKSAPSLPEVYLRRVQTYDGTLVGSGLDPAVERDTKQYPILASCIDDAEHIPIAFTIPYELRRRLDAIKAMRLNMPIVVDYDDEFAVTPPSIVKPSDQATTDAATMAMSSIIDDAFCDSMRKEFGASLDMEGTSVKAILGITKAILGQLMNVSEWFMPHDVGVPYPALGALTGPCRMLVSDPGNPGGRDACGGNEWPPDTRWETDAELRVRIVAEMGKR